MNRIAAALLIVIAILALNGMLVRELFAAEAAASGPKTATIRTDSPPQIEVREGSRVLALILALKALQTQSVKL